MTNNVLVNAYYTFIKLEGDPIFDFYMLILQS